MAIYQTGINQQNGSVWRPIRRRDGQHELIGGAAAGRAACSPFITAKYQQEIIYNGLAALALVRKPGPKAYFEGELDIATVEEALFRAEKQAASQPQGSRCPQRFQ